LQAAFELFLTGDPIEDISGFLEQFNTNLPADIRALDIQEVPQSFNIIKHCKEKEYRYFFACGQKIHPFCAPLMAGIPETLEMDLMMEAAPYFEGSHDFRAYTAKNENERDFIRTIRYCRLGKNTLLTANFFPPDSYMLVVRGSGFMRYQVRMMMGALLELGRGNLNLQDLKSSLEAGNSSRLSYVAPGSGLLLHSVKFG